MRSFAPVFLMVFGLSACATDPAPRLSREPQSATPADAGAGTDATPSQGPALADCPANDSATCTPNVGAHCTSDRDCAQCADVLQAHGTCRVRVATAVDCVDSVCKKTGCPAQRCPEGQSCGGCVANLPCTCSPAVPPSGGR